MTEFGLMYLHLPTGDARIRGIVPGDDAVTPEIGPKMWDALPVALGGGMLLFEGLDPMRNSTTTGPVVDLRHEPPAFDSYGFDWAGRSTSDVAAKAAEYGWRVITRVDAAELLAERGFVVPARYGQHAGTQPGWMHSVLWDDQVDDRTWYVPESSTGFRYVHTRSAFVARDTDGDPPASMAETLTTGHGNALAHALARMAKLVPPFADRPAS